MRGPAIIRPGAQLHVTVPRKVPAVNGLKAASLNVAAQADAAMRPFRVKALSHTTPRYLKVSV